MAELAKKLLVCTTVLKNKFYFKPETILAIRPDRKYPQMVHVKTTYINKETGKHIWFNLLHTIEEFAEMYSKVTDYKGD